MFVEFVKFIENYRNFKNGEIFTCQPITLLVGDQGCGKSTMLQLFSQNKQNTMEIKLTPEGNKGVDTFYFDFEKHNPRIKDPITYTNADGSNKGIGIGAALKSKFESHGEVLVEFSVNAIKKAENCIIFLDEPESALSLRNQYNLVKEIDNANKRNCQIIVATHCLPLIEYADNVLSLEHKKWMSNNDFINSQKHNNNE